MNKIFKNVLCIIMLLLCLLCFCSCDSNNESSTKDKNVVKQYITGRYELQSIEWANGTVASDSTLQLSEETMGDMYVELYSDGTAQLSLYGNIYDMEFSEDKMTQINFELNTYDFSVGNGEVTLKQSGDTYIFVKK